MYKPNFCCDCGEKIESAKWKFWTTNRFCDDCSSHLDYPLRRLLTPIVGALFLAGGAFIIGQSVVEKRPPIVVSQNAPPQAAAPQTNQPQPAKSAVAQPTNQTPLEAKPQTLVASAPPQIPVQPTIEEAVYYCGARTQKGTLCTRRKRGGGRCWQHEGKPALVAQEKLRITR